MEESTLATGRKSKSSEKPVAAKNGKTKSTVTSKSSASSAGSESTTTKTGSTKTKLQGKSVSIEQRNLMIETAAYFIAEHNGFQSNPVDDWLIAESQINQQIG